MTRAQIISIVLLVFLVSLPGPLHAQAPRELSGEDIADLERTIERNRSMAAEERGRAQQWDELAGKARERAAEASNPVVKDTWERTARNHEAQAKQLRESATEWERRAQAAEAELKTARRKPEPAPTQAARERPVAAPSPPAELTTAPPSDPARKARERSIDEFLGKWTDESSGAEFEIARKDGASAGNDLVLKGKYQWEGKFKPARAPTPARVEFVRWPEPQEMNPEAPKWAREQVHLQLRWHLDLELDDDSCIPALKGKWYRGEINWTDAKGSKTGKPEAWAESRVRDMPVEWEPGPPERDEDEWEWQPELRIVSTRQKLSERLPAETLVGDEEFYIEVVVPREEVKKLGPRLAVTMRSGRASRTIQASFTSAHSPSTGPAIYSHDGPISVDDALEEMFRLTPIQPVEFSVSAGGRAATAKVTAYADSLTFGFERNTEVLGQLALIYEQAQDQSRNEAAKEEFAQRLRMVNNATAVTRQEFSRHRAYAIGSEYIRLLTSEGLWARGGGRTGMLWRPINSDGKPEPDPRYRGVVYYSAYERGQIESAYLAGQQGQLAQYEAITRMVRRMALATVGVDQTIIIVAGQTIDGDPVDSTGRIAAALNLGGTIILGGIALQASRIESAAAATATTSATRSATTASTVTRGATVSRGARATRGAFSRRRALGQAEPAVGEPFFPLREVPPPRTPVHLEGTLRGAKSVSKGGYGLQRFDDTCGVVVKEMIRRALGLSPIADEGLATMLMRKVRTSLRRPRGGKAPQPGKPFIEEAVPGYEPGLGTHREGIASLGNEGVKVRLPEVTTVKDIKTGLASGEQVAVIITTQRGGQHWVQVKEIVKKAGGDFVRYGDPWNGGIWEVPCIAFDGAMHRGSAVFAKLAQ
jgi:hypothetical protein